MFKIFRDLSAGANLEGNVHTLAHCKISRVLLGKLCLSRKAGSIYLSPHPVSKQN